MFSAGAVCCCSALAVVVAFVVIGFPCPTRDGFQEGDVAGREGAGGVGGTLGGGPGADAKVVDGGIGGDLANVVGASVSV